MSWQEKIRAHYRGAWHFEGSVCRFEKGPLHQLPKDFAVLCYPPRAERPMWTYATSCMSQPDDRQPIELHMFSPRQAEEIVELLVVTAHYHHTGARLDLGHSVNFGRPWLDNSRCSFGLISLPYLDGPSLENLPRGSAIVKCYWLIPITAAEMEFKKTRGLEALEEQFDQAKLDYLNPNRQSTVQ